MTRKIERLTDRSVKANIKKGKGYYPDGNGLYQQVTASGASSWVFRYKRDGKARDMGLGGYPAVSLSDARRKAKDAREHRAAGNDPINERNAAALKKRLEETRSVTFREAAEQLI